MCIWESVIQTLVPAGSEPMATYLALQAVSGGAAMGGAGGDFAGAQGEASRQRTSLSSWLLGEQLF